MHICRAKYVHLRIKMFGWLSINYLTFSRPLRFGSWIKIWWITSTTQMLEEKLCFDCFSESLQRKTKKQKQNKNKTGRMAGIHQKIQSPQSWVSKTSQIIISLISDCLSLLAFNIPLLILPQTDFFFFLIKAITTKYEQKKVYLRGKINFIWTFTGCQVPNISRFLMTLLMLV